MDLEFSLPEDKKDEVIALIEELGELLDLADDAYKNEDQDGAERFLSTASEMVNQLDELCKDLDGYEEHKDLWRSGSQAVKDGQFDVAIEDMRNFVAQFK